MNHLILLGAGLSVAVALWAGLLAVGEIYWRLNKRRVGTEICPSGTAAWSQAVKRRTPPKAGQPLRPAPPRYARFSYVASDQRLLDS